MNKELIKNIEQALEKATDGPWSVTPLPWSDLGTTIRTGTGDPHGQDIICSTDLEFLGLGEEDSNSEHNAHLIANAPTWLSQLLDIVKEKDAQLTQAIKRAEWISVEDRLPEEGFGWFWVVWSNGERTEYSKGWYNEQAIYKWWHETGGHYSLPICNVTHWKPISTPKE